MEKKYYWLKLKEDFFQDVRMKKLRKIAGGDTYTIIYLKLQLLSIKNGGILIYNGYLETVEEEFAMAIDEDVQNVKMTLAFLSANKLIEEVEKNKYLLTETIKCIGSETAVAERVRKHREEQNEKNQKLLYSSNENEYNLSKNALHCNNLVTNCNADVTNCNTDVTNCNTEKREEIEKREDKREEMFEAFWNLYPKKLNRKQCFTAFCNIKGLKNEYPRIIEALKQDRESDQWQRNYGQFIPYPLTWLHQERWKRQIETLQKENYDLPDYMKDENRPKEEIIDEEAIELAKKLFN